MSEYYQTKPLFPQYEEYRQTKYTSSLYELERVRLINDLIEPINQGNGGHALDIACNIGFFSQLLSAKGYNVIGIDNDEKQISIAKKINETDQVSYFCTDVNEYFHQNIRSFNLILCLELIEHILEHENFLKNICNSLNKGGYLIISTPNRLSPEGFVGYLNQRKTGIQWNAWDRTHLKIFSSFEFIGLIRKSGFKLRKVIGYYYKSERLLFKLPFMGYWLRIPISNSAVTPINRFGFNTIVLAQKK